MANLITTLGPKSADEVGMILPHEHIYVDMQAGERTEPADVTPADVIALMAPEVEKARAAGMTVLVDCTPVGVGRRVDLVKAVSKATNYPIVAPTGIYREPWVPDWACEADEEKLRDWMLSELQGEIEDTGVQAAWIKLSAGDDGLTPCETKILRAAAKAGIVTNAIIGSHTRLGRVALDELDVIEAAGYTPERFIWIHTQNEEDFDIHLEAARRGAWLEYDAIGGGRSDEFFIRRILDVLDAGYGDQVMLSHDRGWYDPSQPDGGTPRPFTYISEVFLPKLRDAGVDDATIKQLTQDNPFRAFAR
jgi:phosphotriesterase-related protein